MAAPPPARVIESSGELSSITTNPDLSCAVRHVDDTAGEFFGNNACGTFVSIDGTLYGPTVPAGGEAHVTPYRFLSSVGPTGTGTRGDPFKIVTTVALGETGVTLVQTDTYVIGDDNYLTEVTFPGVSGSHHVVLYRAGDCFLQNSDSGFGRVDNIGGTTARQPSPVRRRLCRDQQQRYRWHAAGAVQADHPRQQLLRGPLLRGLGRHQYTAAVPQHVHL